MSRSPLESVTRGLFLALVALLPLHTVFFRAGGVAWKPWLLLLIVVAVLDVWRARSLPWPRRVLVGLGVFLATALVSGPALGLSERGWHLWLALGVGGLLLLVTSLHARDTNSVLRVVFWSSAAMGATALVLALFTNGVFGEAAVTRLNDIFLIDRVNKQAYLGSGFVALTNWHQDPGYSALWTNAWLVLSGYAWIRGAVRAPRWVGPVVLGGLMAACVLTFSRTGWFGLCVGVVSLVVGNWSEGRESVIPVLRLLGLAVLTAVLLLGALVVSDREGVGADVVESIEFRLAYLGVLGQIDLGVEGVIDPDLVVGDNRLEVWGEYWDRFTQAPVRGIGLGKGWGEDGLQEPHNLWLELLAENGIVGLVGFLVMVASIGRRPGVVAGSVLAVVGFATLSQTVLFEAVLWFALGLWLANVERERQSAALVAVA